MEDFIFLMLYADLGITLGRALKECVEGRLEEGVKGWFRLCNNRQASARLLSVLKTGLISTCIILK